MEEAVAEEQAAGVVSEVRRICEEYQEGDEEGLWFPAKTFARWDAHFVVDFVQQHQNAIDTVLFDDCTFEDVETVDILKNGFASINGVEVKVWFEPAPFPNDIQRLGYFPSLTELATNMLLGTWRIGDDDFGYIVDSTLRGSGKRRLKHLNVSGSSLTSKSLQHATRLVQQSKLECLDMGGNRGLLKNHVRVQSFCEDGLKKAKYIKRLDVSRCGAGHSFVSYRSVSLAGFYDMIADALTINTSLTEMDLFQGTGTRDEEDLLHDELIQPFLRRNIQFANVLADVQAALLLNRQQQQQQQDDENDGTRPIPDGFWRQLLLNTAFPDFPDKSALFLALRDVTVGEDGEATKLLVEAVLGAMAELDRARREQEQHEGIQYV